MQAVVAASVLGGALGLALILVAFGLVLSSRRMKYRSPNVSSINERGITMDGRLAPPVGEQHTLVELLLVPR